MSKPIFTIADMDSTYLTSLEVKFLEELGDVIELEVITESEYFHQYFSRPCHSDVLIIDEELYGTELKKHNIPNVFLLTDEHDTEGTDSLDVTKIFKYTTPNDIYNKIISLCSGDVINRVQKEKETEIITVYSAAGGVGKTTLALALSECLSRRYKSVLYINAENMNTFRHMIKDCNATIPNHIFSILTSGAGCRLDVLEGCIQKCGFDYIAPFPAALISLGLDMSVYETMIESAQNSGKYDVIIVDTDSVFDLHKAALLAKADKVLLITSQSRASICAMNTLTKNISCSDSNKYHFICNDFDSDRYNAISASNQQMNFIINEYVEHITDIDMTDLKKLAQDPSVQKLSYLVL